MSLMMDFLFDSKMGRLDSSDTGINRYWISVIDLEACLIGEELKFLSRVVQDVDAIKHFTSEPTLEDTVNTTRVCIPFVLFVCISSAYISSAFHGPLDVLIDFVKFGFVSGDPRSDFDDDERVNARGNIVIGKLFKQR
jgi:hypothetical protein